MIIFSDKTNFKRENFPALFDYLDSHAFEYGFDESNPALKSAWGNYDYAAFSHEYRAAAESKVRIYNGIDVDDCVKDEFFSRHALNDGWGASGKQSESELTAFLTENFPDELRDCRAAACYWIDYWEQTFSRLKPAAAITFGGNLIYSRVFLAIAKKMGIPGFVAEHFFTGHDFYFEPRYSSIPNASFLRSKRFTDALNKQKPPADSDVWRKIYSQKNKNVQQPAFTSYKLRNYALVLAQVPNDFSIFSSQNKWKNSIGFYKSVIAEILEFTTDPIVIKVHPYERMKNKGASVSTFDAIKDYREQLAYEKRARLHIVEDYSLTGLISGCKYAITLNSQSGLEVAAHGKPLICFGGAFYGRRGFTTDLDEIAQLRDVVPTLGFSERILTSYVAFLNAAFCHLIGNDEGHKFSAIFSNINLRVKSGGRLKVQDSLKSTELAGVMVPAVTVNRVSSTERPKSSSGRRKQLWRKFKKDPRAYCLDSKHALLRFIGRKVL